MKTPAKQGSPNDFQTPPKALKPLLPYLKKDWTIWECAAGKGNLSNELKRLGFEVIATDILDHFDFLTNKPIGTADERHLWPEMLRVIRLSQPQWIVAENVRGLLTWNNGLVFEQVCTDLEASGYEVQPFIIPAVAVNAPHRRDRIWFIANRPSNRRSGRGAQAEAEEGYAEEPEPRGQLPSRPEGRDSDAPHSKSRYDRGNARELSQTHEQQTKERQEKWPTEYSSPSWSSDWIEVAAELCSVDDGLPVTLDGFELSKSRHRKEQLKAYGNAIVPQVAIEIMKGIDETSRNHYSN